MNETSSEPVWYKDGLPFHCSMCGDCCTGTPGYVWVNDDEMQAIADYLQQPVAQVTAIHSRLTRQGRSLREKDNHDCVFYDKTAGCTIYPVRPWQCRTWPFWESNLKTPHAWQKTCAICPGAGEGDLIPVEEITRRLKVIPL